MKQNSLDSNLVLYLRSVGVTGLSELTFVKLLEQYLAHIGTMEMLFEYIIQIKVCVNVLS